MANATAPFQHLLESAIPFLSQAYQEINIERLKHLDGLGLDLTGRRVIDLGAGIGDHSLFYLMKDCHVTALEGRSDLVDFIRYRLGIPAVTCDMETDLALLRSYSGFDFVHCYGLLYHLSNPAEFLAAAANVGETLLLETIVSPDDSGEANLVAEDRTNATQAVSGLGCRPNRRWLFAAMKALFPFVYVPFRQPRHPQFPCMWEAPNTTHSRVVFIGSHSPVQSRELSTEFLNSYRQ